MTDTGVPIVQYEMVADDIRLAELCKLLSSAPLLAVDTEFVRTDTYYPKLGLLQFNDGKNCYLVDPLSIDDLEPLRQLFVNPNVVKIFHSCSEDLEAIHHFFQVLPEPLFDTQLAAAFLGFGSSVGYRNIVSTMYGVELSKESTRSDWLKRPLSEVQLKYAALDVEYLIQICNELSRQLLDQGKLAWFEEEQSGVTANFLNSKREELYYLRVKSAWRLSSAQLAALQKLCQWREQKAKQLDLPRGRVVKDQSLLDICSKGFDRLEDLNKAEELYPKAIRKFGEQIIDIVRTSASFSESQFPEKLPAPLSPSVSKKYKAAKRWVGEIAENTGIVRELLLPKKDLEGIMRSGLHTGNYRIPDSVAEWRKEVVAQPLLNWLEER